MKPHPRIRKTIKWGGLALCLLLAGVWVRSEFVSDWYEWSSGTVCWGRGSVGFMSADYSTMERGYAARPMTFWAEREWWYKGEGHMGAFVREIPLWFPLAPTLLATAAAWRLDALARRRARAGVCPKCHYDRTGLAASAVCPECGGALAR